MKPTPWNPWEEFDKLRAETDHMWDRFFEKLKHVEPEHPPIGFLPSADFVETEQDYRVYLSIPGLVEQDIDVSVDENELTVRGEREPPYDQQQHRPRVSEWRYGFFERRISLPGAIDISSVKATYEAGVLTIVATKSHQAKP